MSPPPSKIHVTNNFAASVPAEAQRAARVRCPLIHSSSVYAPQCSGACVRIHSSSLHAPQCSGARVLTSNRHVGSAWPSLSVIPSHQSSQAISHHRPSVFLSCFPTMANAPQPCFLASMGSKPQACFRLKGTAQRAWPQPSTRLHVKSA